MKGKNPLRLFVIVRDFLAMVDKVCVEIARGTCRGEQRESRNAVKLPPNFMSYRWRSNSGG